MNSPSGQVWGSARPVPQVASPDLPHYNHSLYEPMWRALDERGMGAIWHASVGREKPLWRWSGTERGWEALLMLDIETLHHSTLKYLLLAGVPERHPNMKFGYVESGSEWVTPILRTIDRYFAAPTMDPSHKLQMKPSEQWARQGFCAGPLDAKEIDQRHTVGVGNLLFGSDYIHTEGTFPNTRPHLAEHGEEDPRESRLLQLDRARLARRQVPILQGQGAAPGQVGQDARCRYQRR